MSEQWAAEKAQRVGVLFSLMSPHLCGVLGGAGLTLGVLGFVAHLPPQNYGGWLLAGLVSFYTSHSVNRFREKERESLVVTVAVLTEKLALLERDIDSLRRRR